MDGWGGSSLAGCVVGSLRRGGPKGQTHTTGAWSFLTHFSQEQRQRRQMSGRPGVSQARVQAGRVYWRQHYAPRTMPTGPRCVARYRTKRGLIQSARPRMPQAVHFAFLFGFRSPWGNAVRHKLPRVPAWNTSDADPGATVGHVSTHPCPYFL